MSNHFTHTQSQLRELADRAITLARTRGASSAQVMLSESNGLSIGMRQQRLTSRTQYSNSSMSVTVFRGNHQGTTSTTDFSISGIKEMVSAAIDIASHTGEDSFSGLADARYYSQLTQNLDIYHPWEIDEKASIKMAIEIEHGISSCGSEVVSDGVWINKGHYQFNLMNSHGFTGGALYSNHSIAAQALANRNGNSQIDYWSSVSCSPDLLMPTDCLGIKAGGIALAFLNSKPLLTNVRCPVLFMPQASMTLLYHFVQATSGALLYNNNSFLAGKLGEAVFNRHVTLQEDPFIPRGLASRLFDGDGISGKKRNIIENGYLNGYFLSAYAARRLDMEPTGNGWGPGNLSLTSSLTSNKDDFIGMLKKLDNGLVIHEFTGGEPNMMTGDYSRSLRGFWVENGEIKHAVNGITIASNLVDMYQGIIAIGNDRYTQGGLTTGSVLIDNIQVSGR